LDKYDVARGLRWADDMSAFTSRSEASWHPEKLKTILWQPVTDS
jgi:hypothetical protein